MRISDWSSDVCSSDLFSVFDYCRGKKMRANLVYIYRHTLPVRLMHWINVLCFVVLLMSGLNIFNAHPALNLGKSTYNGRSEERRVGHECVSTCRSRCSPYH